jgi:hypothetical protein
MLNCVLMQGEGDCLPRGMILEICVNVTGSKLAGCSAGFFMCFYHLSSQKKVKLYAVRKEGYL